MTDQQIHVNVQSGAGEILRIVATLLMFGGAGAIAWSVAQGQYAELAATGFSMILVMMVKLMWARGMIAVPSNGDGEGFETTKSTLAQIASEYRRWLAGTSLPAMTAIAIGYALAFLLLRAAVSAALQVFQNVYIAGGAAAMVGAVVVFPTLLPSILSSLKRKGVVTTPAPAAPVDAQAPAQAPAPAAAPAPRPAPQPVEPAGAPVPPKKVVRRVIKKENTDV